MHYSPHSYRPSSARLAVLAISLASLAACNLQLSTDVEAKDVWKRSYPLTADGTVLLSNSNGRIDVTVGDGDTVTISAERIVRARTEEAAKQQLELFEMKEDIAPDRVSVDSRTSGITINVSRRVNYTVTIPKTASLTLQTSNGDIHVSDIGGHFKAEASNGRVTATGLHKGADVTTSNGVVSLAFDEVGEGVSAETANGMITVTLPRSVNADLSARVMNGSISNDGLDLQVSEDSRRRLDGRLGTGGPMIRLETTNGAIRIKGTD